MKNEINSRLIKQKKGAVKSKISHLKLSSQENKEKKNEKE